MSDFLSSAYPWVKSLHVIAVISWMAGIFYLPRLFVHHAERAGEGSNMATTFAMMEGKLFKVIMTPAMSVTWVCGLLMVFTPGIVDWGLVWPWVKAAAVLTMTGFHGWCGGRVKEFASGTNTLTGKQLRLANEVPTLLMIVIVVMVIARPF